MKKKYFSLALLGLLILGFASLALADGGSEFDRYGFRKLEGGQAISREIKSRDLQAYSEIPGKSGVDLEKTWTVNFNQNFGFKDIDAAVIERGQEYIPVSIYRTRQNSLLISPESGFLPEESYRLKIILANGRRYGMNFTTKKAIRDMENMDNTSILRASPIRPDEKLRGALEGSEENYYSFEVKEEGELSLEFLSLNNTSLNIYLYGENYEEGYMESAYSKNKGKVVEALRPGIYYIEIKSNNSQYNPYELHLDFKASPNPDDQAGSSFLYAKEIAMGSHKGNVGYRSGWRKRNKEDYYSFEVEEEGELSLEFSSLNNESLSVYLYGENYEEGNMESAYTENTSKIVEALRPGVYYIRVKTSNDSHHSNYELKLNFEASPNPDDQAGSSFLYAKEIAMGSHKGNVGYRSGRGRRNKEDYYSFEVGEEGQLSLEFSSLNNKSLSVYLYGENYEEGTMESAYTENTSKIVEALRPGVYYIRVKTSNDSHHSNYELKLNFEASPNPDDQAGSSFLYAKEIAMGSHKGNVGYKSGRNKGNLVDYYSFKVEEEGELVLDFVSLNKTSLNFELYGENYEDGYMGRLSAENKGAIIRELEPGSYYIKIEISNNSKHSPYEFNLKYN